MLPTEGKEIGLPIYLGEESMEGLQESKHYKRLQRGDGEKLFSPDRPSDRQTNHGDNRGE